MENNIHIVTVATSEEGYMKWLKQSCERHGTNLVVLGFGEKWEGYTMKYNLLLNYIKNLPKNDIICFVDAYDVLMLQNIKILKERFLSLNVKKIVCAIENQENIIIEKIFNKVLWETDKLLLNSGTYIGFVEQLQDMLIYNLNICNFDLSTDDQKLLNSYFKKNPNNIYIDIDNNFFYTRSIATKEGLLDQNNYNTNACFIHKNGNGLLNNLLKTQGYNFTLIDEINIYKGLIEIFPKKIKYHLTNFCDNILKKI